MNRTIIFGFCLLIVNIIIPSEAKCFNKIGIDHLLESNDSTSSFQKYFVNTLERLEGAPNFNQSVYDNSLLGKCNIKINGTIGDVKVEGEVLIEGINFFECLAIKIADLFNGSF